MGQSKFFCGIDQKEITFGDYKTRAPLFMQKVHLMGGIFLADYDAVRRFVPSIYHPIKVLFRKALVSINAIEYGETDVGPYNEVAISVLISPPDGPFPFIVREITSTLMKSFHSYVLELPVDTDISVQGGREIFDFPKFLTDISFRDVGGHRICTLREKESLDLILEIECRTIKIYYHPQNGSLNTMTINTYPPSGETSKRGRVHINHIEKGMKFFLPYTSIRFGKHKLANRLRELNIGHSIMYIFSPQSEAILSIPEGP